MKKTLRYLALLAGSLLSADAADGSSRLQMEFVTRFHGVPLVFDQLTNTNTDVIGQPLSVTRLDFLVSEIALRDHNGTWREGLHEYAYVSTRDRIAHFEINSVPIGRFDRLRFLIGLKPEINHRNPATYDANHPLNPELNGLHWNWQGGYVFMALEGRWRRPDGELGGYSYHLATDQQLVAIELPITLNLISNHTLRLALNLERIFSGPTGITLDATTTSTHSRSNDPLATQLRENVKRAFSAEHIGPGPVFTPGTKQEALVEIAADATPYRLTFSSSFPRPALPTDNPLTEEAVLLGRKLFFDQRLSINNSQSCASCHHLSAAFTDGKSVSIGAEGQAGTRNAMPLFNLAWKSSLFWDGRTTTLRQQVLQPIENPIEMHESLTNVVKKLQTDARSDLRSDSRSPDQGERTRYAALFDQAFGTPEITTDRIARALEQFLLTRISHSSRFDQVLAGEAELSEQEKRGFELFHTEYDPRRGQAGADCFHCHGGPLFRSQDFANNGLDTQSNDPGRSAVTDRGGDQGKFAVPSLRNVALTAPYMHDGRFESLEQVINHYTSGIKRSRTLDPNLAKHPDGGVPLGEADKRALIAFLKTLTDRDYQTPHKQHQ